MPIEIDGYAVLGLIAGRPDVFPTIKADAIKAAKAFVGKQLKDKALTLSGLTLVADVIGMENFDLVIGGFSDAEIKALIAKVDKLNGDIKAAGATAQYKHVADLARGLVLPAEKAMAPSKAAKPPPVSKPPVERSGNSKAMRARKKV